jgi:hypothetical protein
MPDLEAKVSLLTDLMSQCNVVPPLVAADEAGVNIHPPHQLPCSTPATQVQAAAAAAAAAAGESDGGDTDGKKKKVPRHQ